MRGGHGVYCHRDTSMYSDPEKRVHPNEKPLGLMKWCVEKIASDIIIDPYMGSGTTIEACIRKGRRAIGVEVSEAYFQIAVKRCEKAFNEERTSLFRKAEVEQQGELFTA